MRRATRATVGISHTSRLIDVLAFTILGANSVSGQGTFTQPDPCQGEVSDVQPVTPQSCPAGTSIPLPPGQFAATALVDGNPNLLYPGPGAAHREIVSLYGIYGNNESTSGYQEAVDHYNAGVTLANSIQPISADGFSAATLAVVEGFSNANIEVCGGGGMEGDAWDPLLENHDLPRLAGQACATQCLNPRNGDVSNSWNDTMDGITQKSLLWQLYSQGRNSQIGTNVYIFDGAKGAEPLSNWDPLSPDPNNAWVYPWSHKN